MEHVLWKMPDGIIYSGNTVRMKRILLLVLVAIRLDDLPTGNSEFTVFPIQKEGLLGPNRISERVKVIKCPSTGEYVMYMHTDDTKYCDPCIGHATSKNY